MGVLREEDQNLPPQNTGLQRNTLEGFSSILDTVGALAHQRQKLRASFFLIAEYALDGETGGAATEAQILQRNESRDIHMPRGALKTEGPKNQNPRPFAQTARDKDGVPGLLSFTSWAATPAAQDLRGGSTQRAGHSVHRYVRRGRMPCRERALSGERNKQPPSSGLFRLSTGWRLRHRR